jgi:hypothetical protein
MHATKPRWSLASRTARSDPTASSTTVTSSMIVSSGQASCGLERSEQPHAPRVRDDEPSRAGQPLRKRAIVGRSQFSSTFDIQPAK